MRGGVTRTLEYNSDDKLTRVLDAGVEVARYEYDGAGRRVGSVIGGVERKYYVAPSIGDGFESPQIVLDGSGTPVGGYAFAGEHAVAKWTAQGWEYYLQDAMGSVIGMASASGTSTASIKYDSFGNVTSATGAGAGISSTLGSEPRYHGMQLDAVSGLYHVRARTYDARTGRFTSRDPVAGFASRPESMSPYVFCNSNGATWRDPTGEFTVMQLTVAGAIAGVLYAVAMPSFRAYIGKAKALRTGALIAAGGDQAQAGYDQALKDLNGFAVAGAVAVPTWWSQGAGTGISLAPRAPSSSAMAMRGFATSGLYAFGVAVLTSHVTTEVMEFINYAKDGTPRTNTAQNKQFADAVREIERQLGRALSDAERQELHRWISGEGLGFWDIVEAGLGLFGV